MGRPLTNDEFANLQNGTYPSLKLAEDQWGEFGYFYDTTHHHFGWYAIDRKEQTDEVTPLASADQVLKHAAVDLRPAVEAWIALLPR